MSKKRSVMTAQAKSDVNGQLRKLTAENRRLQREIDSLKNELNAYQGKSEFRKNSDKYYHVLQNRSQAEYMYSKKNFVSFLFAQIKTTSFFNIYRRVVNAFRRYSFITTSLKIFSIIFLFVEASLLVLVSTSAFVASLVFTLLVSHIFVGATIFTRKKYNTLNKDLLNQKNVYIFFPPKKRAFDHYSYFNGFVREQAKNNSVVVIVSPYVFSSTGLEHSKKAYSCCRSDGENVILVRRSYYFTLKKKVIEKVATSVTEIY